VPCFSDVSAAAPVSRHRQVDACDADDVVWDALQELEAKAASDAHGKPQHRANPSAVWERQSQEHGNRVDEDVALTPVGQVGDSDDDDFEPSPPTPPSLHKLRKVVPDIRRTAACKLNRIGEGKGSSARKKRLKTGSPPCMDSMPVCDDPGLPRSKDVRPLSPKSYPDSVLELQSNPRSFSASQTLFPAAPLKNASRPMTGRPVGRTLPFAYERDSEEQQHRRVLHEDASFLVDGELANDISTSPSCSQGRPPLGKSFASADIDIRPSQGQGIGKAPRKRLWPSLFNDDDDDDALAASPFQKSCDAVIQHEVRAQEVRDKRLLTHQARIALGPSSGLVSGSETIPFLPEETSDAALGSPRNGRPSVQCRFVESALDSPQNCLGGGLVETNLLNRSAKERDARLHKPGSVDLSLDSSEDKELNLVDDASKLPLAPAQQRKPSSNHCPPSNELTPTSRSLATPSRRRLSMTSCSPRTTGAKYLCDHGAGLDHTPANTDSESEPPVVRHPVKRRLKRTLDELGDPYDVLVVRKAPRVSPVFANNPVNSTAAIDSEWLHERSIQNFSDSDSEIQPRCELPASHSTTDRRLCGNGADRSLRRDLFPTEQSPGCLSNAESSKIRMLRNPSSIGSNHPKTSHLPCVPDVGPAAASVMLSTDENLLTENLSAPPYNVKAILCNPGENMESMLDRLGEEYVIEEIFKARESGRRIVGADALGFSDDLEVPKPSLNAGLIRKFKDSLGREKKHYDLEAATATLTGAKEKFAEKYSRLRGNGKPFRGKQRSFRKAGFRGRSRR
jgi:hypothetical protein